MSRVVIGVGASRATLTNSFGAEIEGVERDACRDALVGARRRIAAVGADVAIVVGSSLTCAPRTDMLTPFTLGVGEVVGIFGHGRPVEPRPADRTLARELLNGLASCGFDIAFTEHSRMDHGAGRAIQHLLPADMPVVPLAVNCFGSPPPSLQQCLLLGDAVAAIISADAAGRRVAAVASGCLPRRPPFPLWRRPHAPGSAVLRHAGRRSFRQIVDLSDDRTTAAGIGAYELRNWLVMAGACGWAPGRTLGCSPLAGVAVIDDISHSPSLLSDP